MDEVELLERLAALYSPSGHEERAVAEFVRAARALGLRSRVDRAGNGIAERGRGRPETLFLGHIDTVEGDRAVRRDGRRLHGRGVVDAKGPLVSALVAASGFSGAGTVRVVAAVREETDSLGARHLLRGRCPNAVIVGEPSGWDGVTIGYKGELRVEATFRTPRSHDASPTPSAADSAIDWVHGVKARAAARPGPSPFRTLSVKVVGFENPPRTDPDVARLTLDLRLPPGVSTAEAEQLLHASSGPSTTRPLVRVEPIEADRTNVVVSALLGGIRGLGGRPTLWRKTGTSDLNVVLRAWGVPGAAYGPGDSRLDHTDREAVSFVELRRSVRVLREAFGTLAAVPSTTPR